VTSANLVLVRSLYTDWARGDWSSVDWADPEIEFLGADMLPPVRAKGLGELAETWREFLETWEGWRVEPEEYRELDDERILVLIRLSGRGKTSGLEVEQMRAEGANLFHIRNGRVTRLVLYWSRERALADLGVA
jgi:ketosteroid isomerase-like protein